MIVDIELQTNEIDLYGVPPTVSGGGGAVDSVNGETGVVVLNQDEVLDGTTYKQYSGTEKTKPDDNIINQYEIVDEAAPAIEIAVPLVAVDNFLETLEDPATNSIAEIKLALKDFLNEMKAG
jgi:uncharacterized protein affecting Mg2+/Co2+ transport